MGQVLNWIVTVLYNSNELGTKGADASVEHLTYTVTAAIIPFCTAITKQ